MKKICVKNNSPEVSVIISAYNHEKYVKKAILSVINQTFESIELLVIDDGSTDKTFEEINSLYEICKRRFVNVVLKKQENRGICATLNSLLEMSLGKYIFGLASDDIVLDKTIELFYEFLSQNKQYSLVVGENKFIDADGRICYWDENKNVTYEASARYKSFTSYLEENNKRVDFDSENFGTYETLFVGNYIPNGYLVRKSIYQLSGQYRVEAPLEDYWLMLQISKFSKMKFIRETTFYYRCHETNTVKDTKRMSKMNRMTRQYEYNLLISEYPDLHKKLGCYFYTNYKRYLLNLNKLKIYKTRSVENKLFCIEIGNFIFNIKYKRIKLL